MVTKNNSTPYSLINNHARLPEFGRREGSRAGVRRQLSRNTKTRSENTGKNGNTGEMKTPEKTETQAELGTPEVHMEIPWSIHSRSPEAAISV